MPGTKTASRRTSKPKSRTLGRKTSVERATVHRRTSSRKAATRKQGEETTYIYECTRPGCGYRIIRDEKAEQGQVRSDLKCPKCHHQEFRCLGKGDLPETFNTPTPAAPLDLETFKPIGLGPN